MEDIHRIWPHRWVTPKAKSNGSEIHDLGVIATQDIQKGESVGVLGGVIVPKKEIGKYWKKMNHVGIQFDDDFFIVPTTRQELKETGVFNHSCDPNCGFANSITLITIKNIKKGEELTFDYAFCESFMEEFKCNCGSPNCRKVIKPTDWKNPELQQKYGKYFSPYLKAKF
jgi:uncharacterized protein